MHAASIANIWRLGIKELWSLVRDPMMLVLIVYTFTVSIYVAATAMPESLHKAAIAIVDEDDSPLSARIVASFYPPHFTTPRLITLAEMDAGMDNGTYTFVLDIPPNFQREVLAGLAPAVQLNVDATRMSQAFTGSGYIQQIVAGEVNEFVQRHRSGAPLPVDLNVRMRFNPNLEQAWFGSLMEIINNVTMLSIILTGAALIREREHGTIEHLLVMPVTPGEIMLAKVWSMGLVVLLAALVALVFVVQGVLKVPVQGSVLLFMVLSALHLFATTSMGIFLATVARSMPQFGMLLVLTLLPLQMLSGGVTPRESMPEFVQQVMLAAPTTHFVAGAPGHLFPGGRPAAPPSPRRYYRKLDRYSAALALCADVFMGVLGGKLKFKEKLSARLGDVLSYLYIASSMLKQYEDNGRPEADRPFLAWGFHECMWLIQNALDGAIRNFPVRPVAWLLRVLVFPLGRREVPPSDRLGRRVAALLTAPNEALDRLTDWVYTTPTPNNTIGRMKALLPDVIAAEPVDRKFGKALKSGQFTSHDYLGQLAEAQQAGVISEAEAELLRRVREGVFEFISVDDFDTDELRAFKTRADAA